MISILNMCSAAGKRDERRTTNDQWQLLVVRRSPFVMILLLWLLLTGCAAAPPVVKVGLVGPFEGRYREIGYDAIYSARLAVREANGTGGIGPYRLALVALDDGGDPELAAQIAASLVLDPAVTAVIGHWLPETTAVAEPIYREAGVLFIPGGRPPYGPVDPAELSPEFVAAYAAVTPFDETVGPYAGPAYAAMRHIFTLMTEVVADGSPLTRAALLGIAD
jgi:hypothetical protein